MRNLQSGKIVFADTLRGLAAILVVFGHYLGVFWFGREIVAAQVNVSPVPASIETPAFAYWFNGPLYINYSIFGVALFFLVSGFVIPFSLRRLNGLAFLVGRFFRLVPTYAAGFTVTLCSIAFATWYFGGAWQYTMSHVVVQYLLGTRDLIWSPNIDPVIWTLEVEVKFYIVCALMAPLFRKLSPLVFLAPIAISLASYMFWTSTTGNFGDGYAYTVPFVLSTSGLYIVFMFIGVAFHYWYIGRLSAFAATGIAATLFSMVMLLWTQAKSIPPFLDHVPSYAYAVLAFLVLSQCERFLKGRVFGFAAKISYPLYVTHCAFGYVMMRVLLDLSISPAIALIITCATVTVIAYAIHKLVEAPSHVMGKRASTLVMQGLGPAASVNPTGGV